MIHWPLMGELLHSVQRESPPRCTKYNNPPINCQCTNFVLLLCHYSCICTLSGELCVLVHRCLNGAAPQYLSYSWSSRCQTYRLTSSTTFYTHSWSSAAGYTRRSTIGGRGLAVADPHAWNNRPVDLRLSRTFSIFKTHVKSHLFNISFPSVWLYHWLFLYWALESTCAAYASLNLSLLHYITLQRQGKWAE